MGGIAVAAVAAFILVCTCVVPVTAATRGSYGGAGTARKLLSEQDAIYLNPDVVGYWKQKVGNVGMPEAMASLVSRLSPKDAARFQEAITSKKLLDPSQDSLAASFCSAAGLLCTNSQSSKDDSGGPVDRELWWPYPNHYWTALPNSQPSGPVGKNWNAAPNSEPSKDGSGGPVHDKQGWWTNPIWNALPNSQPSGPVGKNWNALPNSQPSGPVGKNWNALPNSQPSGPVGKNWNAAPDSEPSKDGSGGPVHDKQVIWGNPNWNALSQSKPEEHYSESELAKARHVYFLPKDMPSSGATVPAELVAELLADSPTRGSGAYLPRRLVSALGSLRWPEFLQALRTPAGSPWAATLASTLQQCDRYNGTFEAEKRTCARSLEDLADFLASQLVPESGTNLQLAVEVSGGVERQSQAAAAGSLEVVTVEKRSPRSRSAVVCHDMGSFAYKLLACHTIQDTEIYSVTLKSSVEPSVDSFSNVVACHTDTKTFRPDHIAFRVLGIKPGQAGVCHYTHPGVTAFYHNDE